MPTARLDSLELPEGSPPRWPKTLPAGPALWDPSKTKWTDDNTDGLFACQFIEATIRLTKGRQRGELVQLRHWQGDFICDVLRLRADGRRAYRTYELFIARKNSKSLLGAGLALDGLFDEPGAEVYSCAADKDQAKIVFGEVRQAVEMSADLDASKGGLLKVYRDAIEYPAQGSVYRALSAEAFTKEGLNPSRVIFDEKHAQPSDELWDVMNQGSGTREQPLVLTLTTKGVKTYSDGTDTICLRHYEYGRKVQAGEIDDPTWGCRIYETAGVNDDDFDYTDETRWSEANPALGDFLFLEDMQAKCRSQLEADFKTKRLNIWVTSGEVWLPDGKWAARANPDRGVPADGTEIVVGFDGSYSGDSTALVGATLEPVPHLFVIEAWERKDSDDPDWRVPISEVEHAIRLACQRWQVREVACDPFRWQRSMEALLEEDWPIVEFDTSKPARMVPACAAFFDAVTDAQLTHDGDPRLARHIENCRVKRDRLGPRIVKDHKWSPRKIDLAVSAVVAHERAVFYRDESSDPFFVLVG